MIIFFGWEGCNYYIETNIKAIETRNSLLERKKPIQRNSYLTPKDIKKPKRVTNKNKVKVSFETFINEYCDIRKKMASTCNKKYAIFSNV